MYITACKALLVESLASGFKAINPLPNNNPPGIELIPQSIGVDYPEQENYWPGCLVQFHPTKNQYTGLFPDTIVQVSNESTFQQQRQLYFEGSWDISIYSTLSEERDRLWESLIDLFLLNSVSPGATAFWDSVNNYDLVSATLLPGTVEPLGDTISPGVPWKPELLIYEASIRVQGCGVFNPPTLGQIYNPLTQVLLNAGSYLSPQIANFTIPPT